MNWLHKIIILVLFIQLVGTLKAQHKYGYFNGVVFDKDNHETLIGANIKAMRNPSVGAATDLNGEFSIKLAAGHYIFVITYTGMTTDTVLFDLKAGQTIQKSIQLTMYVNQLQGVEVSVGRFNQKPEDLTVTLEVLQPKFIENKITTNIEEVLDFVPGLNIVDGDPQIRGGSGFTFGVGSKVGVFVDGMPVLSADANRPLWDMVPTDNIKQVEVVKGASSVLSGSSSLSGAIYVKTADAPLKPLTKVNAYGGFYSNPKYDYMKWWSQFPYIGGVSLMHARAGKQDDIIVSVDVNMDHGYEGPPKPLPLVVDTLTNFSETQMAEKRYRLSINYRHRNQKYKGLFYGINGNAMYNNTKLALAWLDDSTGFYRTYPGGVLLQKNYLFYLDPYINYYTALGTAHSLKTRYLYSYTNMSNDQSTTSSIIYADYNFKKDYTKLGGFKFIGGITRILANGVQI